MSFILEYRKKNVAKESEKRAVRKANEGFVALPVDDAAETRTSFRWVMMTLCIVCGFLAVLNSRGLVTYNYGMADSRLGRKLVVGSERWYRLMGDGQVTRVVDQICESVAMVRKATG